MIGFKSDQIYYNRSKRIAGETKYPFKKSFSLAIEGITSLSTKPLRIITLLGIVISSLSILNIFQLIILRIAGKTIEDWSSIIIIFSFFGGLQIMALSIVGEYIGKIYKEVKKRPKYFIEEKCNSDKSLDI